MLRGVGDIERFVATAKPGASIPYGRGAHPPRDLVQAMEPFVASGALHPKSKREDGGWLFMVERGSGRLPGRMSRGAIRRPLIRRSSLSMVLQCLTLAAAKGQPCPSLDEIARRCRLGSKRSAGRRVELLVRRGKIAVEDRGPHARRVVTVLTGRHAGAKTREAAI